jgi:hypothetical protein
MTDFTYVGTWEGHPGKPPTAAQKERVEFIQKLNGFQPILKVKHFIMCLNLNIADEVFDSFREDDEDPYE